MSFRLQFGEDSVSAGEVSRIAANASTGRPAAPFFCRVAATPYPTYSPCHCTLQSSTLVSMATETAGVGGLKIAETFPAGRGSPHGCGLRAVFCTDAASARPEACRDKSKVPRSGDFGGQSPGVQGAAATGRPLCAPCAMRDITQKTFRERNVPGNSIEQPFLQE